MVLQHLLFLVGFSKMTEFQLFKEIFDWVPEDEALSAKQSFHYLILTGQ